MDMEDEESSESDFPGGNSEFGGVVPGALSIGMSMKLDAVTSSSAVAVGIGGGVLIMGKKKRGRPRKYDSDGKIRAEYVNSPGFTLSTTPFYGYMSGAKRGRGRSSASANWKALSSMGELLLHSAGGDFTPHVVTVYTGEDIAGKILTFAGKGSRGVCVLSANGSVSNVTLRQSGSSGGLLTYEGRFEILTLMGSYTLWDNGGIKSRSGGLSVSLASPDGRVIGGVVAGLLMAATPIQIVVGSFEPNAFVPQKRKQNAEAFHLPVSAAPALASSQLRGQEDESIGNKGVRNGIKDHLQIILLEH